MYEERRGKVKFSNDTRRERNILHLEKKTLNGIKQRKYLKCDYDRTMMEQIQHYIHINVHKWCIQFIDYILLLDNDEDDDGINTSWMDDTRRMLQKKKHSKEDIVEDIVTEHASKVKDYSNSTSTHAVVDESSSSSYYDYNTTTTVITEGDNVSVSIGERFRYFVDKYYPYDTKYLPIITLSILFLIVLLISSSAAFRCHYQLSKHHHLRHSSSHGDRTRSVFYDWFTVAILARLVCMSWEAAISYKDEEYLICLHTPGCILARSLPDLVFASAYTVLVLFYAYLAGKASSSGPRGISLLLNEHFNYFTAGNVIVYVTYISLLLCAYMEYIPLLTFQLFTYGLLFTLYGINLLLIIYFGPLLYTLLSPVMLKVAGRGLSTKLICMCLICLFVFLSRFICFGLALIYKEARDTHGLVPYYLIPVPPSEEEDDIKSMFNNQEDDNVLRRDLFGNTLLELLPTIAILTMMHQSTYKKYQIENNNENSTSDDSSNHSIIREEQQEQEQEQDQSATTTTPSAAAADANHTTTDDETKPLLSSTDGSAYSAKVYGGAK